MPPAAPHPPEFTVVVPSRGEPTRLLELLEALARQSFPRERFEIVLAIEGQVREPRLVARIAALGARLALRSARRGPGAARNAGARLAEREWIAFTEDDVTPPPDWLERAAARIVAEPGCDVIEGRTVRPGGRSLRIRLQDAPQFIPTNLFVKRAWFERVGGYCEDFYNPATGVYFREDADFGFALEEAGARIVRDPELVVTHPDEHPGFLDPLRWARRYEMDALLEARHPRLFHERIEVHHLGALRVRRPIVRASLGFVLSTTTAFVTWALGRGDLAVLFLFGSALLLVPLAVKWRFAPLRILVCPLVPFVMIAALVRGQLRARRLMRYAPAPGAA